ncbi:hypothetical protein [Lactococcus garvieae]|uniref:hypothetical protein n=1 Tax=Lactococcus garvieae TaxID=1363 RepID=UPI0028917EBB|nr:hypothetical protein [Lactococcus garvieae]MDT2741613.1 hypothetical protein [Lactococcus garvieae]
MTVDRSYSPYESIRNYHDRGMMKWGAFATGELSEAQRKLREKEELENETLPKKATSKLDD